MAEQVTTDRHAPSHWHARHGAALAVRVTAALIPVVLSIAAACAVARFIGPQHLGWIGWLLPGIVALAVVFVTERLCRRLLPLASLLRLTLAFPDRAPSRLSIAMRTGTVKQLRRWTDELERSENDVDAARAAERVLTLAAALNAHDRRTRGHSERVRALTDLVAVDMGLTEHDADRLRWAALLHDIGKLAVPATILNKAGKPDADEWSVLQRHPEEGGQLIGPLADWMGEWASAVDSHHERFDGTGYPRGLAGADISLAGRIVAVTDSFETMTAVRSYKRAMSFPDARAELQRCAGTHFDPAVVRVMYGVSLPRLMWALGPLAALGHIPLVALLAQGSSLVPAIGEAAKTAALAGAASVALTGVVALQPVTTAAAASAGLPTPAPAPAEVAQPDSAHGATASVAPPGSVRTSVVVTTSVEARPGDGGPAAASTTVTGADSPTRDFVGDAPATTTSPTTVATTSTTIGPTTTTAVTVKPTKPRVDLDPVVSVDDGVLDDVTDVVPVTAVEITVPEITVPAIELPEIEVPKVTLPKLPF